VTASVAGVTASVAGANASAADVTASVAGATARGTLRAGTSGFAYPGWSPAFYPPGTPSRDLLGAYASRLDACELNNTYYRQPTPERIAGWVDATPDTFRFTVKAQRGGSLRALAADPAPTLGWLVEPLAAFGVRLGAILFRVPADVPRDDERVGRLLEAWPRSIPVAFEFQDPSWERDEVHRILSDAGAALCATELDEREAPTIRLTGSFLYLRLRRAAYSDRDLAAWSDRIAPFLDAGHDVYAFFRHDETGISALRAERLQRLVERVGTAGEG
jgi:uncharacterized protein YecE (DUF72 family)